jgi:hypothetical protein
MRRASGLTIALAALPLVGMGFYAWAGDGVSVNITNDGTEDILVTVYDTSSGSNTPVLRNARINGFTSIPLSVSPDASGLANLSWTAVSADPNSRKCGHAQSTGLKDSASVNVHADSACTPGQLQTT